MSKTKVDFTDSRMRAARMKDSTVLTERQEGIYAYVRGRILSGDPAPTVREIGEVFGIRSPNGVICHLKALGVCPRIASHRGLRVLCGARQRSLPTSARTGPVNCHTGNI